MRPRSLVLVGVLAACAGCGGGGGDAAQKPATTAARPAVDPAVAVRARRAALRAELHRYRALRGRTISNAFYALDGLALQLGSRHFKADSRQLRAYTRGVDTMDIGSAAFDAYEQRLYRRQWATLVPTWQRFARKLARLHPGGPLVRSARDFQLTEWRRSIAVMREFLHLLRTQEPGFTRDDFYQKRAFGQATRWPVVVAEPYVRRKALRRGLQRDLRRLDDTTRLTTRSPSVGDVYRRTIAHAFVSPLRKVKTREQRVAAQEWMLFRIKQLEDTPDDVYEAARSTIMLQSLQEARGPYDSLRDVGLALQDVYLSSYRDLRRARRLRTWALGMLARPVPPLLEPMRDRMVAIYKGLDLASPPDKLEIFDLGDAVRRESKRMIRVLRKGARLADSPRTLRRATVQAVAATRPR